MADGCASARPTSTPSRSRSISNSMRGSKTASLGKSPSGCFWPISRNRVKFGCSCRLAVLLSACLTLTTSLAAAQVDTVAKQRPLFTWRDAVLAGGFGLGTIAIRPLDSRAAASLQRPQSQQNRVLRDASIAFRTIAVPGSVIIGVSMYTVGRLGKNDRLATLGLHGTEALFVGEGFA